MATPLHQDQKKELLKVVSVVLSLDVTAITVAGEEGRIIVYILRQMLLQNLPKDNANTVCTFMGQMHGHVKGNGARKNASIT